MTLVRNIALFAAMLAAACSSAQATGAQDDDHLSAILRNFDRNEPFYVLGGTSPANLKLQFSFRYQTFGDTKSESCLQKENVYIGMTITGFWNLAADSAPFEDTNYKPELIYACKSSFSNSSPYVPAIHWRAAARHESNGKGGPESRSLNKVYIEPALEWGESPSVQFRLAPRVWTYFAIASENADVAKFLGHASLAASLSQKDKWLFRVTGQRGDQARRGNLTVDASIWPNWFFKTESLPNLYWHFQYFTGYGENLINYDNRMIKALNRSSTRFRIGFSIVP